MKRFNDRMRHEFGGGKQDIWHMNMRFVFETWWWPLTIEGYGGWKLDLSFRNKNLTVVELTNSAVAQSMALAGKPVCHLYAGLFAGAFSFYDKTERECIEVQCYSMGNDRCKFLIGDKKQVNAADFWRREGANAADILRNFEG
jgi:predicted hydrocarbon binding protein